MEMKPIKIYSSLNSTGGYHLHYCQSVFNSNNYISIICILYYIIIIIILIIIIIAARK